MLKDDEDAGEAAAEYFRLGCATDPESCRALAHFLRPSERRWALKTLMWHCEHGHAESCTRLGDFLLEDSRDSVDLAGAIDAYTRGCNLGYPGACRILADATSEGEYGAMRDVDAGAALLGRAVQYAEAWCAKGVSRGCDQLEDLYSSLAAFNFEGALRAHAASCDAGRKQACTRGPDAQWSEDAGWDELSCALGDSQSCWAAAWKLRQGQPAPRALALAGHLDDWACTHGIGGACTELAEAMVGGDGWTPRASSTPATAGRSTRRAACASPAG